MQKSLILDKQIIAIPQVNKLINILSQSLMVMTQKFVIS